MRVSLIATVLNEEASIEGLLQSILAQTRPPDEVVIVDGGSTDRTVDILRSFQEKLPLRILVEPGGNISQGRNRAIAAAGGEIIACTDGGVRLCPEWLALLLEPFEGKGSSSPGLPPVACGFFVADHRSVFETAMGATVLPDVEEIRSSCFLPSSRSVAYTREAWRRVGGYPEWLDYGEDLIFDRSLRRAGYPFFWVPRAIAHFRPRPTLLAFFRQYYRYARGDGKANLWPKRHLVRYSSYLLGLGVIVLGFVYPWLWLLIVAGAALHLYKPYRRLLPKMKGGAFRDRIEAVLWVPLIQMTGDVAKMVGYPVGVWWRIRTSAALP